MVILILLMNFMLMTLEYASAYQSIYIKNAYQSTHFRMSNKFRSNKIYCHELDSLLLIDLILGLRGSRTRSPSKASCFCENPISRNCEQCCKSLKQIQRFSYYSGYLCRCVDLPFFRVLPCKTRSRSQRDFLYQFSRFSGYSWQASRALGASCARALRATD